MDNITAFKSVTHTSFVSSSSPTALYSFLKSPYTLTLGIGYILLCRLLRYRRMHSIERGYYYNKTNATKEIPRPLSQMTDQEAHEIIIALSELEFPAMFEKGLQLALFRTYGIASGTKLLVATQQLSNSKNVGKRYTDTEVLVAEIYGNPPSSERGIDAFARMNYIHSHYLKAGKILNSDMLYTLALFMNHPALCINQYEWRSLTDIETCALGVWHLSMGMAMNINFDALPSAKTGWRDGLHFFQELDTWASEYELTAMVPDQANWETATKTEALLLGTYPEFMHGALDQVIKAALDKRWRTAVMFDEPGMLAPLFIKGFTGTRKLLLRYLALPRPEFLKFRVIVDDADEKGRRHMSRYAAFPYYIKPTLWTRYEPFTWMRRWLGLPLPGDDGMESAGFITSEVGPVAFKGKGQKEAELTRQRLRKERTGGCPFGVVN